MYQDGYNNRQDFFNFSLPLIQEFSNDDEIKNFIDRYRIDYSSEHTVIFLFFMELSQLKISDSQKLKENLYQIINYADICFNLSYPEYHNIFVKQFYSIMLFLISENKFELMSTYDSIFSNMLFDKYLNQDLIIYFGYIALNQVKSVISLYNNQNFFLSSDLTKIANIIPFLEKRIDEIYNKLELDTSYGTEWYKYGE